MAAVSITAPNPEFDGSRAGVRFVDGKAEVDELAADQEAYFARHGYSVKKATPPKTAAKS